MKDDKSGSAYVVDRPIQIKEVSSITSLAGHMTVWARSSDGQAMVTLGDGTIISLSSPQGADWQNSVLDRFDPTGGLPGGPSIGARYISTATANGWTNKYIYQYNGVTWDEAIPNEGFAALVEDENLWYLFNGTDWVLWGSILSTNTAPADVTKSSAASGSSSELARRDHKHDITTAVATAQAPGDTASESVGGTTTTLSRSDHRHSLPAFGTIAGTFCEGNDSRVIAGGSFTSDTARYGFTSRYTTGISFDGTDKFTLTDKGSGWSYYRNGVKCSITGNKDVTVASPMFDGTIYYIFIDATNGTLTSSISAWTLNDTKVPVATVYWDSGLTPKYLLADERHTCLIDRQIHRYEHLSEGTKFLSGCTLSGLVPGSDTEGDKTFGITATKIADEDIFLELAALTDPSGTVDTYYNVYRTSTTTWDWEISDMPFKYADLGGGNYDYIEYDNGSGTSTKATTNKYVNTYLMVTNAVVNSEADQDKSTAGLRYFIVQGRGAYSTADLARAESFGSFSLTGFPVWESVALYQLTWYATSASTARGRCRYVSTQRITANVITTTVSATASHNTLSGIQGGIAGEYYHMTEAQHDALTKMYGEMGDEAGISHTIYLQSAVHACIGLSSGPISGVTFSSGVFHGDISAIATYGGTKIQITTTAVHDVLQGDYISIIGTTNYDGICQVTDIIGANDFAVDVAYVADEASGLYFRGDALTIPIGGAGDYIISWTACGGVSGGDSCEFIIIVNKVSKRIVLHEMASLAYAFGGSTLVALNDGDVVWFGLKNDTNTNAIFLASMSFAIHRL